MQYWGITLTFDWSRFNVLESAPLNSKKIEATPTKEDLGTSKDLDSKCPTSALRHFISELLRTEGASAELHSLENLVIRLCKKVVTWRTPYIHLREYYYHCYIFHIWHPSISFPEPACLLVSTKTWSSGIINFQRPRFLDFQFHRACVPWFK